MASWTGKIYITINKINGKLYVGQTKTSKSSYIGGGVALKKGINRYGRNNFYKFILADNIGSEEELNILEIYYIKLFDTTNPEKGYNISPGGENKAFTHTIDSIKKIQKRSSQSDNKIRIRNIQKIAVKNRVGQHCSIERKIKMNTNRFGVNRKIDIYNKKEELLYTCDFSKEASTLTGVKRATIANNLAGLSKSAGGFKFTYKIIN